MINKLDKQTTVSKFSLHWVTYTSGLVLKLSYVLYMLHLAYEKYMQL